MNPTLESLQRWTERLCRLLASVGFVALVVMSFLTMFDAVMRWLIWPSIPGFGDWGRLAFPIIICAVFPAVLLYRRNVSIGFLGAGLGPQWNRGLELFAALMTLVFFFFLAWQFTELAVDLQANDRVTPTQKIPVASWWWIATGLVILCLPVQTWMIYKAVLAVHTRKDMEQTDGGH
ncbi:MAG: TRAP transporter small permease subunit [Proteobacteria bacterium]|nr:TRAP transporter small permease subunit [Pseudomonadota bacterium]MDA1059694.1 TRAP transporter small permease subunit [Pseudomonadota bacterium]